MADPLSLLDLKSLREPSCAGQESVDHRQRSGSGEKRVFLNGAADLFERADESPPPRKPRTGPGPVALRDDGRVIARPLQAQKLPAEELPRAPQQRPGQAQEDRPQAPGGTEGREGLRPFIETGPVTGPRQPDGPVVECLEVGTGSGEGRHTGEPLHKPFQVPRAQGILLPAEEIAAPADRAEKDRALVRKRPKPVEEARFTRRRIWRTGQTVQEHRPESAPPLGRRCGRPQRRAREGVLERCVGGSVAS